MKHITTRPLAVLAILAVLGVSAPALAVADTTTTTVASTTTMVTPTTTTTVALTLNQKIVAWHAAVRHYDAARLTILRTYNKSVRTSTRALAVALKAAHGKAAQKAALVTFHAAIKAARDAKVASMLALGAMPVRPTK